MLGPSPAPMWLVALILLFVASPLRVAIIPADELFVGGSVEGKTRLVRGRLPPRLLADINDVVQAVAGARLHCLNEGGKPTLYAAGKISSAETQRLRNLVGTYSVAQIRSGARKG